MKLLLSGGYVLLPDFSVKQADIWVDHGVIAAVGPAPEGFVPDRSLDCGGRAVIPGLINAHTHAYMTIFRNFADDLPFDRWLFGKILPLEDKLTAEDCYYTTLLGCMEMLSTGTTAFLDMYILPDSVTRAASDCGIRAVLSRGLTGGADDPAGGERRIREALADRAAWRHNPRLSFMLGPHAPYSCDEGYLKEVAALSEETGLGIHIHLAEGQTETDVIRAKYGCTPTEFLDRCGILGPRTVAAHCIRLTDSDIGLLTERGVCVVTNPASNLKLANGIAPVPKLLRAGVNVALGTDGSASNNALNMFRELGLLTLLHKGVTVDPTAVTAREGLACATRNGARALGLNAGEITPGRAADLAVIRLDGPNMRPVGDIPAALAYSASGFEVETVLVDGEVLYHRGEYPTIDAQRVLYEVDAVQKRLNMR